MVVIGLWAAADVILVDFMFKERAIDSDVYIDMLKKQKARTHSSACFGPVQGFVGT